jgi:hypothetical protein
VKAGGGLTIERMVKLARVSRASYYRFDEESESGADSDMDLRDAIQRVALEWPSYRRRRITRELHRRGWAVNWKRVYRLMREDNLLCVRKRKFVVTTDSNHGRKVYPNLARQMVLTDVDQLWRADITYIRLREEFIFLAVILDAYSRRVIGWALDRTLEEELTLSALRMALSRRVVEPGLVHHSDHSALKSSCRSILFHRTANSVLTVCLSQGDHPTFSRLFFSSIRTSVSLADLAMVAGCGFLVRVQSLSRIFSKLGQRENAPSKLSCGERTRVQRLK